MNHSLARHPITCFLYFGAPGIDNPFFFPFRKPKRIRTAFSPSQLLKLEQIFEKNHYVVGQERKELAMSLNLTETQVRYVVCHVITSVGSAVAACHMRPWGRHH